MANVKLEDLRAALKRPLAPAYLVCGDEPLLVGEAADLIRAAARAAGYSERSVHFIEKNFDWDALRGSTQSLSLFAQRRILELRLPTGKPDKGAALLSSLALQPMPDLLTLVLTEKLDRKAADAPWVQAFVQKGCHVAVHAVAAADLPEWLAGRAALAGATLTPGAAALIAERVEGNLLAAKQELEKLCLLADGAPITPELAASAVGDSARYDVHQLADAAGAGDGARALRVLLGLKNEGTEPTLVLWALSRELRGLWQAREGQRLRSSQRSAWSLSKKPSAAGLARLRSLPLSQLLVEAGTADRIIKGLAAGDAWTALMRLTAMLAGVLRPAGSLRPGALSGRVAL